VHRTIRITLAVAMMSLAFGVKTASAASPTGRRLNWPCAGCITYIPPTYVAGQPTKVLVALHGDEGDPAGIESVWEPIAKQNNAILIAPKCPVSLGCPGSWWGWLEGTGNYDDSWIGKQVAAVSQSYTLDAAHEYLISWSGGSDYLGWYALQHAS
jgi:poly(3-hydroxybutyrate) depolymerase